MDLKECTEKDAVSACANLREYYWIDFKKENSIQWLEIFFCIVFIAVLLIGLVANSFTLAVFCRLKQKLILTNNNLLVLLNLCVCDNVTVFVVLPFSITILLSDRVLQDTNYKQEADRGLRVMCNVVGFCFNYISRVILLLLAVGALDRFIAIFIPFKYKSIVTPLRMQVTVGICHLLSLLVSALPMIIRGPIYRLDKDYAACHYSVEDLILPSCEDGTKLYNEITNSTVTRCDKGDMISNPETIGTVYFFLVKLLILVPGLMMVVSSTVVVVRLVSRVNEKEEEQKKRGSFLKRGNKKPKVDPQVQAAVTISYLVLLYVICYLPWWVLGTETLFEYTSTLPYLSLVGPISEKFKHYFFLYLTLMTTVSSAFNPLIYFGRNKLLTDKLDDTIKFREKFSIRSQISAPLLSIPTF